MICCLSSSVLAHELAAAANDIGCRTAGDARPGMRGKRLPRGDTPSMGPSPRRREGASPCRIFDHARVASKSLRPPRIEIVQMGPSHFECERGRRRVPLDDRNVGRIATRIAAGVRIDTGGRG